MTARPAWWQRFGTLAQIAQALVALLGFCAVIVQINEIRNNNRQSSTRQVYLAYMDLAFRNPQFSAPDLEAIRAGGPQRLGQYESFVSYFLYACEEAMNAFPGPGEWRKSCDYELRPHLPFLCEVSTARAAYLTTFGADLQQWIRNALQESGLKPPDCKPGKS
jgi:hypothetical protein